MNDPIRAIGSAVDQYGFVSKYDAENRRITVRLDFDNPQVMYEFVRALSTRRGDMWLDPRFEEGA